MKNYDNNDEVLLKQHTGQSGDDDDHQYVRFRQIKFNVSPVEFEKLIENYNKSPQKNIASYCREKALSKPGRIINLSEIKKLFSQNMYFLQKTSSNINQIAKKVNTIKSDYPELIEDLIFEIEEIKRIKIELLKKITGQE